MEWLVLACILAVPVLAWGLTRIIAHAWFKTKRESTRQMLRELGNDNHGGESNG